ncbi:hypothetical protein [Microbacterium cremeum]|uniref:hypothetical protein n=1 Tax=Microbacterium cremeum TaxID=2782169 RepID=UPI0018880EEF|nr:hypothetical protein [Microbacterium cremeum]
MTPDSLDALLDRSSPPTRAADGADLAAMSTAARREGRPARRRRLAITAGAFAVVLLGGAGVATANSDWGWGQGLENPQRSVSYTSPTWGECELRVGNFVAANPFDQLAVDRVIDEWFATTDIEAAMAPLIPKYLRVFEESRASDPEPDTDPRTRDLDYWMAVDQSVGELLHDELGEHGFNDAPGGGVVSGSSQVHCEGEQWR